MQFTAIMDKVRETIQLSHNSLAWHSRPPTETEATLIGKYNFSTTFTKNSAGITPRRCHSVIPVGCLEHFSYFQ